MPRPASLLALVAALACHSSAPSPQQVTTSESATNALVGCVHSALAASTNVAEVRLSEDHPRTQYVKFVIPPGNASSMAVIVAPSSGKPSQLVAEYSFWIGDSQKANNVGMWAPQAADAATRLLLGARNQCTLARDGTPACSLMPAFGQEGQKTQSGRCSIGI